MMIIQKQALFVSSEMLVLFILFLRLNGKAKEEEWPTWFWWQFIKCNENENNKENYLVFFFAVVAGYFLSNKAVQILY